MTDTSHRLYAVAIAVVVFFVSWAAVAAKPWSTAKSDPRLSALSQREQRLRADAKLVRQIVDSRMAAYQATLRARKVQIAVAKAQIAAAKVQMAAAQARSPKVSQSSAPVSHYSAAPTVRVVNLPPLTITRTS